MIKNQKLMAWVEEMRLLCQPDAIHICDGSQEEYEALTELLVRHGTLVPLADDKKPNSFLARSDPRDVARVEGRTFICTENQIDAGPTNNWAPPKEMAEKMRELFKGSMRGRTMYVIPFSMGSLENERSKIGVEITDSAYVVLNMRIMTRMGLEVVQALGDGEFVPCIHSVGLPLTPGDKDPSWPCNPEKTHIVHFPEKKEIWSFGSGYGGNALLGKKCFALRIASYMAYREKWLAEHMLIVGVTNPEGKKKYFAAAFPSACGKTNMAMMQAELPGWKVECVGDDIAWIYWNEKEGQLYAMNPEAGFFGVAPGTSFTSNPNAMESCSRNTIFTNVALTDEGDVWWEKMTANAPDHLIDWLGHDWTPSMKQPAAHPNSRFTAPLTQCPSLDPRFDDPKGVPLSAIIFGGRRSDTIPLVYEATSWTHGVLMGASISSERTAAAEGEMGTLRHDPFAMLPFCGYNMGDYFSHWLRMGENLVDKKPPRFFSVNWFQKDEKGEFLWPGFGANLRVLQWIFARTEGRIGAKETPIGFLPHSTDLELRGMEISEEKLARLLKVDRQKWQIEVSAVSEYLSQFKERLPKALHDELKHLEERLHI